MNTPIQAAAVKAAPDSIQRPFARFDKRRRWNRPVAEQLWRSPDNGTVASRIARCSEWISAAVELPDDGAATAHLRSGMFCKARLCPFCEWRRSLAWQARLVRGLEGYAEEHPSHRALFLTLTVKNCPVAELRQTIRDMHEGWKRMTKLAAFPTDHWLRRTEITVPSPNASVAGRDNGGAGIAPRADINEEDEDPTVTERAKLAPRAAGPLLVHPHIHALLIVPASYYGRGYVKQTEWQALWQMAARLDYPPVVDIRNAYNDEHKRSERAPLSVVVNEAAKYIAKASDVIKLGPYVGELNDQLRGLRLIQASRPLSAYVRNEDITAEEMTDANEAEDSERNRVRVMARWSDGREAYEMHELDQGLGEFGDMSY